MRIPPFHWWRTVFFLIPAISVYTIVLGTLSILSTFVDRKGHAAHWCARAWSWLILATTGVEVSVKRARAGQARRDLRLHLESPEHLRHPGYLRIAAVSAAHHREGIARTLSVSGLAPVRAGHLLVDRRKPDRSGILNRWRRLVTDRLSLIIFPEGTRSADGHVGHFKAGSFLLALEAGLTIVPVSVCGTIHVMKKGRLMTCPGHVTLEVHEPIATSRIESPSADDARELAERIGSIVRGPFEREQDAECHTYPN